MAQHTALMGLITETSLHAGAGSSLDVIDLPIQREGHNGWPCVFGSAVKGALRTVGEAKWNATDQAKLFAVFGPDQRGDPSANAGALAVGDARLLLLPVRSLTSAFRWVTCPEALNRLKRDAERMGLKKKFAFTAPPVSGTAALVTQGSDPLFLEEYRLAIQLHDDMAQIAEVIAQLIHRDVVTDELKERLVIVGNDLFGQLCRNATQVNAHVALDSKTKTASGTALWYEETLPPETVLYAGLMSNASRSKDFKAGAAEVFKHFKGLFTDKPWLQLGGNETVGMGWCAIELVEA